MLILSQLPEAGPDELYDIIVVDPVSYGWIWWLLGLFLFFILLVALGIWLFLRLSKKPPLPPRHFALTRLRELEQRRQTEPANRVALDVSETLKDYLHRQHQESVRFETTEEYLRRYSVDESPLPSAARVALLDFLQQSETVKFGTPDERAEAPPGLIDSALRVIQLSETVSESPSAAKRTDPFD
ncbi:MAG: DUF4381 family protein [Verrucomicrobiota bacterium]